MAKYTIAVSKETRDILNRLSELSGLDVKFIVGEWSKALQPILDENSEAKKCFVLSVRRDNKEGKPSLEVLTFLSFLYSGRMWLPDCTPDETALKAVKEKMGLSNE